MPALPQPDDFGEPTRDRTDGGSATSAVRCPACRREHPYEAPNLPCPCGARFRVPLLHGGIPVQVRFRSWEDSWLWLRCPHCGRGEHWPQPEFTCNCGATVRLPVDRANRLPGTGAAPYRADPYRPCEPTPYRTAPYQPQPGTAPFETALPPQDRWRPRTPFRPYPVHTARDAVLTAARYLEWLGFGDPELTESQERDGATLLGSRMVAQVDTHSEPADVRAIECLWLRTLHSEQMAAAMFAMAGYTHQAAVRGEQLLVALFALGPDGLPEPANGAAEVLLETGWTS